MKFKINNYKTKKFIENLNSDACIHEFKIKKIKRVSKNANIIFQIITKNKVLNIPIFI